jgi:peptidoglycan/xylan/chitin deacetylase (PgdA/CDA1 family)
MKEMPRLAGLTVLGFHSISDLAGTQIAQYGIPKNEFNVVVDTLLHRGFDFIDPRELFDTRSMEGWVRSRRLLITFDDCYEDVLDAFEVLNGRGIRALIFPVSSLVGASNEWDKHLNVPRLGLLGADRLRFLVSNGWIVGSHTHTHSDLTSLDDVAVITEILQSISALNALDLRCAMALAYPYGMHNSRISALAKRTGLKLAFTTEPGFITEQTNPMAIPRIEVHRGDLGETLVNKVWADNGCPPTNA